MFNSPLIPAFAFAGNPIRSESDSPLAARLQAMLPGRGFGRGAPPANLPTPQHLPPDGSAHSTPSPTGLPPEFVDYVEAMGQNIAVLREQMEAMRGDIGQINGRGADSARVFEVLHAELGDYKRDFIFAHIKPLLRPLLFLSDSLDVFDGEMKLYEDAQSAQTLAPDALRGAKVRQNIAFLRDQLIEALGVCEVEPMPIPHGKFDAHFQKAVQTAPVAQEFDGTIVRVIRLGWTLNGQILRPAEVVVGKAEIGKIAGETP